MSPLTAALALAAALALGKAGVPPSRLRHHVAGAVRVTFPSHDGDLTHGAPTQLEGWLFRPTGPGTFPAVVALHSCGGLYAPSGDLSARHRDWAERLVRLGFVVLFPDSFNPRGATETCSLSPEPIRASRERNRDAYGALSYLRHQSFVRPEAISLLGWSHGGTAVLATVAAHTRARPKELAHDFQQAVAFYPSCKAALGSADWAPLVVPLHILIGEADDWSSATECTELVARTKDKGAPADIVVYPGAYHDFDAPDMPVHQRHQLASAPSGTATVGTNPEARADAIDCVPRLLQEGLAQPEAKQDGPAAR